MRPATDTSEFHSAASQDVHTFGKDIAVIDRCATGVAVYAEISGKLFEIFGGHG
jgi:hypothetical protein